ncbi:MAG: hypothetical protein M1826_002970 [Phylliscum demangeonii]|nr:MAG: hypothetical protein M1826_002970 [Phylliscum demangeonii]
MAVTVAQLFRLSRRFAHDQSSIHADHTLGKPISGTLVCLAILVCLVGALRFWRQQAAMLRGQALAGGWEIGVIAVAVVLCLVVILVLLIAVRL